MFSTGFASWYSAGGDNAFVRGDVEADNFEVNFVPVANCFSIDSASSINYNATYGFLMDDGSFTKANNTSLSISGKITFYASTAYAVTDNGTSPLTKDSIKIRISIAAFNSSSAPVSISNTTDFVYVSSVTLIDKDENELSKNGGLVNTPDVVNEVEFNKVSQYFNYTSSSRVATVFNYKIDLTCPTFSNFVGTNTFKIYAYAEDN